MAQEVTKLRKRSMLRNVVYNAYATYDTHCDVYHSALLFFGFSFVFWKRILPSDHGMEHQYFPIKLAISDIIRYRKLSFQFGKSPNLVIHAN